MAEFSVAEFLQNLAMQNFAKFSFAEFSDALDFKDRVSEKSPVLCSPMQTLANGAPTVVFRIHTPWHASSRGHKRPDAQHK